MDLADALIAAIGANDEHQEPKHWLDTGFPPLNEAISGSFFDGMPSGRIVEMFGPPSSGKTAIATKVMASAQTVGGIAAFMDHERSFDLAQGKNLGLDDTPGRWVFKTPDTFEKSIGLVAKMAMTVREKKLIAPEAPIVAVFDSLASMVPQSKFEKDAAEYNMNDNTALARATSAAFPALAGICERTNMLCLFLNQSRTKIGVMYGDPTTTPGGNAPEFYSSVRIKLSRAQLTAGEGKDKRMIGQRITAECVKNKVSRPFRKTTWDFLFNEDGTGSFDVIGSLVDYMVEKGMIESSGPRITWKGSKPFKSAFKKQVADEGLLPELLDMLRAKEGGSLAA